MVTFEICSELEWDELLLSLVNILGHNYKILNPSLLNTEASFWKVNLSLPTKPFHLKTMLWVKSLMAKLSSQILLTSHHETLKDFMKKIGRVDEYVSKINNCFVHTQFLFLIFYLFLSFPPSFVQLTHSNMHSYYQKLWEDFGEHCGGTGTIYNHPHLSPIHTATWVVLHWPTNHLTPKNNNHGVVLLNLFDWVSLTQPQSQNTLS